MGDQERTDERPNAAIGASDAPTAARMTPARDKTSPTSPVEPDTEGQGGKVFGIDPSGVEADNKG